MKRFTKKLGYRSIAIPEKIIVNIISIKVYFFEVPITSNRSKMMSNKTQ